MNQGVYIALSGAKLQELRLELIANNLANVNNSGYKADRLNSRSFVFDLEQAYYERDDTREVEHTRNLESPDTILKAYNGTYTKTSKVGTDFSQGSHKFTGNPLNIALDGPGFIALETPFGDRYTRHGEYHLSSDGELVNADGYKVRGSGLSRLGEGDLFIDSDGNVLLDGKKTGSIDVVEFDDPEILRKEGHNLYVPKIPGNFEQRNKTTVVKQGQLEMPNISVVTEMVKLIELNRLYETYQKQIISMDENTKKLIDDIGRP